jgi:hypothetical protein
VNPAATASDNQNSGNWVDVMGSVAVTTFGAQIRCWHYLNNTSSGTPTFTWTSGSGAFTDTVMVALSGVKTVSALVGTPTKNPSGTGNVSTYTCPTVTPTGAGQALIGGVVEEGAANTNIAPNNGETEIQEAAAHLLQMEWKLTPNTTPVGPSWQINNPNADEVACIAWILDAAASVTGKTNALGGPEGGRATRGPR